MNGTVGKSALVLAVLAMTVFGGAFLATASDNCDTYVKRTLDQVTQNIDRRCKFTGDRWSSNLDLHRRQCSDNGPAFWRAELRIRDEMLAKQCKR